LHTEFDRLDRVLGIERGPGGEPSVNDFLTIDLLPIVDAFATRFDELPEAVRGRPDYRLLISAGVPVRGVAVIGPITSDGSIELLHIRLDFDTQPDEASRPTGRQPSRQVRMAEFCRGADLALGPEPGSSRGPDPGPGLQAPRRRSPPRSRWYGTVRSSPRATNPAH
jgi:hypothetical protein